MKKIDGNPHNGYPTDMGTGTGQIFVQRIRYGGTTTRTLPAPLTSLPVRFIFYFFFTKVAFIKILLDIIPYFNLITNDIQLKFKISLNEYNTYLRINI